MKVQDFFVYGAQYYRPPNPPREQRERDLKRIKKLGFNTIKIWAMWNWTNPEEGKYDFSELRSLLDWAQENNIHVLINTILENVPYWLAEKYPATKYLSADNVRLELQARENTPSGGWPGLCLDNEEIKCEASKFLTHLAKEFVNHPALFVWDIWNEPHMEPHSLESNVFERNLYCYCDGSINKFTAWLKKKHGNIQSLNSSWGTKYGKWTQIQPPRRWAAYSSMLEWIRFWQDNLAELMLWRATTIREIDKTHIVMSHEGLDGVVTKGHNKAPVDEWKLSRDLDQWGCSWFPDWSKTDYCTSSLHTDITLSAAKNKVCWISELQPGAAFDAQSIFLENHPSIADICAWHWMAVGNGFKGILYWQYRPELLGPEAPGLGLTELNGDMNERTEIASKLCNILNEYPVFRKGRPVQPQVGILHNKEVHSFLFCSRKTDEPINSSVEGIYRILWEENIPVKFIHIDQDPIEELKRYRIIFYPFPCCMGKGQTEKIREYVKEGGILVSECHIAQYNEYGFCEQEVPGLGLSDLFGCSRVNCSRINEQTVTLGDNKLHLQTFMECYTGDNTTESIFAENSFGKGKAILIGSLVFSNQANKEFILSLLPEDIHPPVDTEPKSYARILKTEDRIAVILVNTRNEKIRLKISLNEELEGYRNWSEILYDKEVRLRRSSAFIDLKPKDSAVLLGEK